MTTPTDIRTGKVFRLFMCAALLACGFSLRAEGATFFVINNADSGFGTLRNAINGANQNPGPDVINFAIFPKMNLHTIIVQSELPGITENLTIDGWSEGGPGYKGAPLIELRGPALSFGNGGAGLTFPRGVHEGDVGATNSLVRGLIINGFNVGLSISADYITVQGCYVGTTADGESARTNGFGISVDASFCLIGGPNPEDRNVLSGNFQAGVDLYYSGSDNRVEGN
jgi:hypothetical protein